MDIVFPGNSKLGKVDIKTNGETRKLNPRYRKVSNRTPTCGIVNTWEVCEEKLEFTSKS